MSDSNIEINILLSPKQKTNKKKHYCWMRMSKRTEVDNELITYYIFYFVSIDIVWFKHFFFMVVTGYRLCMEIKQTISVWHCISHGIDYINRWQIISANDYIDLNEILSLNLVQFWNLLDLWIWSRLSKSSEHK